MDYSKYKSNLIEIGKRKGFKLDLDNPKTINDKTNWIKLHPTELKCKCTDKIKVHEYSKDILGEDICIPIIKIYDKSSDIDFDELPKQFVIKCNHGCQYNIIVKDKATINKEEIKRKLDKWMSINFAMIAGYEMQYNNIEHKIFVEEYMGNIADYKFWCFNGEPKFWVYSLGNNGQFTNHLNFYDMDCNLTLLNNALHPRDPNIKAVIPKNFENMINVAKQLSKNLILLE